MGDLMATVNLTAFDDILKSKIAEGAPMTFTRTIARIRREYTGEERDTVHTAPCVRREYEGRDTEDLGGVEYWWTEGNGACDCNLSQFYASAGDDESPYPEQNIETDGPCAGRAGCSDGKFTLVKLLVFDDQGNEHQVI